MAAEVSLHEPAARFDMAEATAAFFFADDEAAAKYVQRKWRGRHLRKLLRSFPSLDELKGMYMDAKAVAAGAANSKWYTSVALQAREHVRMSDEVANACEVAWMGVMSAARHSAAAGARETAAGDGGDPEAVAELEVAARATLTAGLTRVAYDVMMRKLYLLAKVEEHDYEFSPRDFTESAEEDWLDDTQGAAVLDEGAFKRCWFQLIDLHTENINAEEYADWSISTLNKITVVHPGTLTRVWRGDDELLALFPRRNGKAAQAAFKKRHSEWHTAFGIVPTPRPALARAATLIEARKLDHEREAARSARAAGSSLDGGDGGGGAGGGGSGGTSLEGGALGALGAHGALGGAGARALLRRAASAGPDRRRGESGSLASSAWSLAIHGAVEQLRQPKWNPAGTPGSSRNLNGEIGGSTRTSCAHALPPIPCPRSAPIQAPFLHGDVMSPLRTTAFPTARWTGTSPKSGSSRCAL